uniref:Uncharacterized protein n=1 Tax=Anguilla anguilla TaxID=7936 RepID=A0A0E9Q6M2_ANGAN
MKVIQIQDLKRKRKGEDSWQPDNGLRKTVYKTLSVSLSLPPSFSLADRGVSRRGRNVAITRLTCIVEGAWLRGGHINIRC